MNHRFVRLFGGCAVLLGVVLAVGLQTATATILTIDPAVDAADYQWGLDTDTNGIKCDGVDVGSVFCNANPLVGDIKTITGDDPLFEVYKENVGDGFDTGSGAPYYETKFLMDPLDPKDATISHTGGSTFSADPLWLLVKDGNQDPRWYLYDLGRLNWDRVMDLELKNFWPNQGAISYIAIYQTNEVPEPGTLVLLGSGLMGLGFWRRWGRRTSKRI